MRLKLEMFTVSCSQLHASKSAGPHKCCFHVCAKCMYCFCVYLLGVTWVLWECGGCQELIYNACLSLSRLLRVQGKERMLSQVSNKSFLPQLRQSSCVSKACAVIPPPGRFSELGFWRGSQWADVVGWIETRTWRHKPTCTVTSINQLKCRNYLAWIMATEHSVTENLMPFNLV